MLILFDLLQLCRTTYRISKQIKRSLLFKRVLRALFSREFTQSCCHIVLVELLICRQLNGAHADSSFPPSHSLPSHCCLNGQEHPRACSLSLLKVSCCDMIRKHSVHIVRVHFNCPLTYSTVKSPAPQIVQSQFFFFVFVFCSKDKYSVTICGANGALGNLHVLIAITFSWCGCPCGYSGPVCAVVLLRGGE